MIRGICSGLRDPDISRGLPRKGNSRNAQLSGAAGDRGPPVGAVIGHRYGILVRRIPERPGRIEHDVVEGLRFLNIDSEPLAGILGLGHIAPSGPIIAVKGIGRRDINRDFVSAEKKRAVRYGG